MIVISWIAAGAVLVVLLVVPTLLRWRRSQIERMMDAREDFFRAADALASDDDTPPLVLGYVEWLSEHIDRPSFARGIFVSAIRGDFRRAAPSGRAEKGQLSMTVDTMRPELQEQFGTAAGSALMAVSYSSVFFGLVLRRLMFFWLIHNARQAEFVAQNMADHDRIDDGFGHNGLGAVA